MREGKVKGVPKIELQFNLNGECVGAIAHIEMDDKSIVKASFNRTNLGSISGGINALDDILPMVIRPLVNQLEV